MEIRKAEDRDLFNKVLDKVGAKYAKSFMAKTFEQGLTEVKTLDFPVILRPNFTLGGGGGGVCKPVSPKVSHPDNFFLMRIFGEKDAQENFRTFPPKKNVGKN